jgi:hypothetical protein
MGTERKLENYRCKTVINGACGMHRLCTQHHPGESGRIGATTVGQKDCFRNVVMWKYFSKMIHPLKIDSYDQKISMKKKTI